MSFRIKGLSPEPFVSLFGLPEAELTARGVIRYQVDKSPGFPDRIEMRDASPGETVLLLNHVCQPADTPYRATHAIFVREGATQVYDEVGAVPDVLRRRLLSLRAYDATGMMRDADVVEGVDAEQAILRLFENAEIAYIHAHNAKRGCYAGLILRG
jgi:hypothetical protein